MEEESVVRRGSKQRKEKQSKGEQSREACVGGSIYAIAIWLPVSLSLLVVPSPFLSPRQGQNCHSVLLQYKIHHF